MKSYILSFIIIFTFGCDVVELRDPTEVIQSKDVISLVAVDSDFNPIGGEQAIAADSISFRLLKVTFAPKTDASKEVVFATTSGVFTTVGQLKSETSQNTITLTPKDRELIVQLNALDLASKNVLVSATTGGISSTLELAFTTAYASNFQIKPQNTSALKTDEIEIVINAIVEEGTISENQYLEISSSSEDDILLDHPQFVKISDQKASFKVINKSQSPGKTVINIEMPISAANTMKKQVTIVYKE